MNIETPPNESTTIMATALTASPVTGLHPFPHPMTSSILHNTSNTKRPRLSLHTSSLPITFGKSSTALSRVSTTASSPTTYNTFSNAYESVSTSTPAAPATASQPSKPSRPTSTYPFNKDQTSDIPYHLPQGVRSILKNSLHPQHHLTKESPLSATLRRRSSLSFNVTPSPYRASPIGHYSPGFCTSAASERPYIFFPVTKTKKVSFRPTLEEEVTTVTYVARHIDLYESDDDIEFSSSREELASTPRSDLDLDATSKSDGEMAQSDDGSDETTSDPDTGVVMSKFSSITSLTDDELTSRDKPSRRHRPCHRLHHRDPRPSLVDKLHHRTPLSPHSTKVTHRKTKRRQKYARLREAYDLIRSQSRTEIQPSTSTECPAQSPVQPPDTTGCS